MLNNLEKFSPRTVMLDVVFIKNETIPQFLSKKLTSEPKLLLKVEKAFNEMDQAFAEALAKYKQCVSGRTAGGNRPDRIFRKPI